MVLWQEEVSLEITSLAKGFSSRLANFLFFAHLSTGIVSGGLCIAWTNSLRWLHASNSKRGLCNSLPT